LIFADPAPRRVCAAARIDCIIVSGHRASSTNPRFRALAKESPPQLIPSSQIVFDVFCDKAA